MTGDNAVGCPLTNTATEMLGHFRKGDDATRRAGDYLKRYDYEAAGHAIESARQEYASAAALLKRCQEQCVHVC